MSQVVSSAIVDKYIGESARLIREMFGYAKEHQPCVIFMDEIDAIGGRRFSEGTSADRSALSLWLQSIPMFCSMQTYGCRLRDRIFVCVLCSVIFARKNECSFIAWVFCTHASDASVLCVQWTVSTGEQSRQIVGPVHGFVKAQLKICIP